MDKNKPASQLSCKYRSLLYRFFRFGGGQAISVFAKIITSPRIVFQHQLSKDRQKVYYANHTSNADTVLIWAAIGRRERTSTRPVAAADYWLASPLRRLIGKDIFNILPIERHAQNRTVDPVSAMADAIGDGSSLIIFPEGRRNDTASPLLDMKPGIYHLAKHHPDIDFVPVWIDNLGSVMPRGEIIPVPLICAVTFGAPINLKDNESQQDFMTRARHALCALAPLDAFNTEDAS